jgi:hypothetical protein
LKTHSLPGTRHRVFSVEGETPSRATREGIVALLHVPQSWPIWQREIVDADGPAPLAVGDVVRGRARMLGFGVQGHATVTDLDPGCLEKDVIVGVRMRIRVEVNDSDDRTKPTLVSYRLVADLPDGPLGRVLSFFLKRRFKKMQELVLSELSELRQ